MIVNKKFSPPESGAYVHVFKRTEVEPVGLDLNFFDGNRTLQEAKALLKALQKAVDFAESEENFLKRAKREEE
jgi:hypothetical protein